MEMMNDFQAIHAHSGLGESKKGLAKAITDPQIGSTTERRPPTGRDTLRGRIAKVRRRLQRHLRDKE